MTIRRLMSTHASGMPGGVARFEAHRSQRPASSLERLVTGRLGSGAALLFVWLRRWRDRQELARLSDAQIRDVGLNPELVRRESAKAFWRA